MSTDVIHSFFYHSPCTGLILLVELTQALGSAIGFPRLSCDSHVNLKVGGQSSVSLLEGHFGSVQRDLSPPQVCHQHQLFQCLPHAPGELRQTHWGGSGWVVFLGPLLIPPHLAFGTWVFLWMHCPFSSIWALVLVGVRKGLFR